MLIIKACHGKFDRCRKMYSVLWQIENTICTLTCQFKVYLRRSAPLPKYHHKHNFSVLLGLRRIVLNTTTLTSLYRQKGSKMLNQMLEGVAKLLAVSLKTAL